MLSPHALWPGCFSYFTAALAAFVTGRDAESKETPTAGEDSVEALRPDVAAMHAKVRGLESYNHLFCSASAIATIKMSALADRLTSEPRAILSMAMAKSREKLFQKVKIKPIAHNRAEEIEYNQASPNGEFRFFKS